jgi:N-acetylneuraminic acid mutarotase
MSRRLRNDRILGSRLARTFLVQIPRWRATVLTLVLALGCSQDDCTQENPRYCGDGTCTDPAFPFCDVNGTLGGLTGECIAPACVPSVFAECRGDIELRCNSAGDGYDEIACEAGCAPNHGCANTYYRLVSIEPRTASPGESLMLEGAFGSTVVVNFPGGISRPATRLGDQRATVDVPDIATAGQLSITTGGVTVGRIPFRRTTFTLGLERFLPPYDQASGARQPPVLSIPRAGATSEVVQGYLYVLGGAANGVPLGSIERAAVNADGSLGAFSPVPVALVTPRSGHESVVIGDYLYVLGGSGSSGALTSIERARIAADGSLGVFETISSTRLTVPRKLASAVIVGSWLYVTGGSGTEILNTIERAPINADGTFGHFAMVSDLSLTTAREGHTSHAIGDVLYVIGGLGGNGQLNTIERANIRPDGLLEPFVSLSNVSLTNARTGHSSAVIGRQLYVIGGRDGSGALASIERASINVDHTLGSFSLGPGLVSARSSHSSAIVGNFLYVITGVGDVGLKTLELASIDAAGGIGAFALDPASALAVNRANHTSAIIRNYLYLIGGNGESNSYQNSVERATIHPDGSVGPFANVAGVFLNVGRANHVSVVLGNYLYVIGGVATGGNHLGNIERAAIRSDGSLGPFELVSGVNLATPRFGHTSAVVGGYLYIFGGQGSVGNGFLNSIERATIVADGSLTQFVPVPVSLVTPRYSHACVVAGSSLYVIGGAGLGGGLSSVERAIINADGTLSAFQTVSSLSRVATSPAVLAVGKFLYVMGDYLGQGLFDRAEIGHGTLGPFVATTGVLTRHASTSALLGNSVYVLGGYVSGGPLSSIERAVIQ